MNLIQSGEFRLIKKISRRAGRRGPGVRVGIGDDAAVVRAAPGRDLLVTTDMLIEGVHFRRDGSTLRQIGRKAMLVNISDIAAMGGRPRFAVVSVGLPKSVRGRKAEGLFDGIDSVARKNGVALVGGDTNAAPRLILNIALIGETCGPTVRPVLRSGACIGDRIYVTGVLGDAARALAAHRHHEPPVRLAVGQALQKIATAMIDISDGLLADLGHIIKESGVGAEVCVDHLPGENPLKMKLTGGEDYELLFAAPSRRKIPARIAGIPVTEIGRIVPRRFGFRLLRADGSLQPLPRRLGFTHF